MNYDHDQYAAKNRYLAESYSAEKRDKELAKRGFDSQKRDDQPSCFNCKLKMKCAEFNKMRGSISGSASVTGNEKHLCDRYIAAPPDNKGAMNDKQVKNLLKSAMKGKLR